MSPLAALLQKDLRVIGRDGFLIAIAAYAFVLALVGRIVVPWLPFEHLDVYLAPVMVLFGPLLLGTVLGFALIEEREQGTWLLLRVLPLDSRNILLYFAGVSSLASFVTGLLSALIYGCPVADTLAFVAMTAISSLSAPVMMLAMAALATNKIEGMAVSKILSIVLLTPAALFVLPMPWQLSVAWCPFYWLYLGLLRAVATSSEPLSAIYWPGLPWWLLMTAPMVLSLALIAFLGRRYLTRAL